MLLPALKNAKLAAKTTICASNMKTIGQSLHMYANDWNGYIPPGLSWSYSLGDYVNMPASRYGYWTSSTTWVPLFNANKANVFYCDAGRFRLPVVSFLYQISYDVTYCNSSAAGVNKGGLYPYNNTGLDTDAGLSIPKQITTIPERSIMISEFYKSTYNAYTTRYHGTGYLTPATFNAAYSPDYCHSNSANMLAIDGSVSLIKWSTTFDVNWIPKN
jgi:prepilin-type processing-associated H-X9-DG protein